MSSRRELPRPPARIRAARLVNGEIQPFIGAHIEPQVRARQELLELWDNLSQQGRKAVLTAARLTAREEGVLPVETAVIAWDDEVA